MSKIKVLDQITIDKIAAGKAHELSESDTMYLGACTKGATAEKSTVPQYYNPDVKARKRAFCFKNSYMTTVLNDYIVKDVTTYEPIIKDDSVNINPEIVFLIPISSRIFKLALNLVKSNLPVLTLTAYDKCICSS